MKPGLIGDLYPFDCLKKPIFDIIIKHNSFSINGTILKLADKEGMDEVLHKLENCPDQIIYFRATST